MDTSTNIFKPVGVVTAIAFESDAIISQFDPGTTQEMSDSRLPNGMKLYRGRIGKREIYLLEAGAGKICAAAGTQVLLLIKNDISAVYNIGIAGSLDHTLQIRDIVIVQQLLHAIACRLHLLRIIHIQRKTLAVLIRIMRLAQHQHPPALRPQLLRHLASKPTRPTKNDMHMLSIARAHVIH